MGLVAQASETEKSPCDCSSLFDRVLFLFFLSLLDTFLLVHKAAIDSLSADFFGSRLTTIVIP